MGGMHPPTEVLLRTNVTGDTVATPPNKNTAVQVVVELYYL